MQHEGRYWHIQGTRMSLRPYQQPHPPIWIAAHSHGAAARAGGLLAQVVHDEKAERVFDVPGTPYLLVLDEMGVVRGKGTVNNLEQVEGLVDTARRRMREDGARWAS